MDFDKLNRDIAYSGVSGTPGKWIGQLTDPQLVLVTAFRASLTWKTGKAADSAKSLVARYIVTGQLSTGNSGDSQKSALRHFVEFGESRWLFNLR
jgi:tRNA isopentenyl-2-thiomethyl-A-37 hydroxylase MiaE